MFDSIRKGFRRRKLRKEIAELRKLTVGDIMTKYVITVRPEDEVIKAATKMIAEDISCLIVAVDSTPVGILSERDFLKKAPFDTKVFKMKVKDIMTPDPITVPRSMGLEKAVALMKQHNFRRLIVAEENKLLGVVTQTDFTRTLSNIFTIYPSMPELTIGHIMTKRVVSITPKDSILKAKESMTKGDVGAVLIVNNQKEGTPLGIFTEYDVVMQFYDQHGKFEVKPVENYMRKHVRAMPPTETVFEANRLMLSKNMRRLLVVEGDKIVGIVTQTDICRYTYGAMEMIGKASEDAKADLKSFPLSTEIHGEFRGEHLKVYNVE